jgi:uncharacterized protein YqfB (UPF0267 family)
MTYITASDVRRASGAPSSLISDADVNEAITIVENEMERWMNTAFVPTQKIEHRDGNSLQRMFLMKNPLLSVRALTVNDSTSITPSTIDWEKQSGKITLSNDAESGTFTQGTNNTFIKYLYGLLEESTTRTTLSIATAVGTSVSMTVGSESGFSDGDWVEIYGMDGKQEVAKITGTPTANTIVVDQLVQTHAVDSEIIKLQIPYYIKRFMEIEAAIYIAVYAIGGTYAFNTSYSLGELSVNKGEPYPQWREVIQRMINERKMRRESIKIRPSILVD